MLLFLCKLATGQGLNTQSHEAISRLSWPAAQAHGPPALGTRNGKDVLVSSELSIKPHLPSCSSHQARMTSPEQSPENSFSMLKLPDSSIVAKGSIFPFWLCLPSSSQICQAQEPKLSATSVISDCHDSDHWCPATNTALVLCRSSWHCSPPTPPCES